MMTDRRQAFEFIDQLDRLSDAVSVMNAMHRALGLHGFEFFCFNGFPRPDQGFDEVIFAIRVPQAWLQLYLDEQYIHVDPTIRHCKQTVRPFEYTSAPYDLEREPRAAEVIERATDFGLSKGMLIPIPSPSGCIGNVWIGGYRPDFKDISIPMVHLTALYAFERVRKLNPHAAGKVPRLTAREREVLTWIAQGKSSWEIGEILAITKRTVDEHAQVATRKLGAVNRTQAVAIALRERLLRL